MSLNMGLSLVEPGLSQNLNLGLVESGPGLGNKQAQLLALWLQVYPRPKDKG